MAQKLFAQDESYLTKTATEDIGAYRFVKLNASDASKIDIADTAGEMVLGVLDADMDYSEDPLARVVYRGITYVKAGGTVAADDYVTTDANGAAVKASTGAAVAHIAGRAMNGGVSGDLIAVDLMPELGALLDNSGGLNKILVIPVTRVALATEQDTGIDLPAKAIVRGVYLDVITKEDTGGTKTIDIGTDGTGSNDPDGFIAAASVAAAGIVTGIFTAAGQTVGALLSEDEGGTGELVPVPDCSSGGESITYTLGSNDFAELVANIVIDYIELS